MFYLILDCHETHERCLSSVSQHVLQGKRIFLHRETDVRVQTSVSLHLGYNENYYKRVVYDCLTMF